MIAVKEPPRLTPKQKKVLQFLWQSYHTHGYPPTVREIMRHFGWSSTNAVQTHIGPLEKKGYVVRREADIVRGIELVGAVVRLEYASTPAGQRLREAIEGDDH